MTINQGEQVQYTIGGKPPVPQNGHILIAHAQDPANLETEGGLTIANLGFKGQFIGEVVAVSPGIPHCVEVGDIVYVKDPDLTGALKVDGGERLFSVREQLVWAVVRGVEARPFTESDARAMAQNMQKKSASNLVVPQKELQLVTQ